MKYHTLSGFTTEISCRSVLETRLSTSRLPASVIPSEGWEGDREGQGSLACCSPRGRKELNMTYWHQQVQQQLVFSFITWRNWTILVVTKFFGFYAVRKFQTTKGDMTSLETEFCQMGQGLADLSLILLHLPPEHTANLYFQLHLLFCSVTRWVPTNEMWMEGMCFSCRRGQ